MNKKGKTIIWQPVVGAFLIFLGAWFYGQYEGTIKFLGIILIAGGIGLVINSWK